MEFSPVVLVAVVALAAAVVLSAVVLLSHRANRRHRLAAEAELARSRAEAEELRARVDALAVQLARPVRHEPEEFVITSLHDPGHDFDEPSTSGATDQRIDGKLFVDLLARETVVKAAAFGHGVRRALAPETRNRVRFEMKREVKRSRKSRKDEFKRVRAEMRARERRSAFIDSPRIPGQPNTAAGSR